jgi:hypothetical protein
VTARPYRRARRAFWTLVVIAVLLTGVLGRLLQAPPSPRTGIAVAVLGLLAVTVVGLAARLLLALTGRLPPREETRSATDRTGRPT